VGNDAADVVTVQDSAPPSDATPGMDASPDVTADVAADVAPVDAPNEAVPEASGDACAALTGTGTQVDPYTLSTPAADCDAYLAMLGACAASGWYQIQPGPGSPFADQCDMTTLGGGWTLVIASYSAALAPALRTYLYEDSGRWYQSPPTTLDWNWAVGQELTGTYGYFDGTSSGTFACAGSSETPQYGIGCSNGPGGTFKCIPLSTTANPPGTPNQFLGQAIICQDQPNAFGAAVPCPSGVSIFTRPASPTDAAADSPAD
jgi:hypothetical protein